MLIRLLNKLLRKYMWVYERDNGDCGFVIAKNRNEAIKKLADCYTDAKERIAKTDETEWVDNDWMYLFDANHSEIEGDIFIIMPY